jgi:hypothetical protein
MTTLALHSLEPQLGASLDELEAASGRLRASYDHLLSSALEFVRAEQAVQSAAFTLPGDEDEEDGPEHDAPSLHEEFKFALGVALERALEGLAEQEDAVGRARATLEQVQNSLQLGNGLHLSMPLGPKPGFCCACQSEK